MYYNDCVWIELIKKINNKYKVELNKLIFISHISRKSLYKHIISDCYFLLLKLQICK